MQATDNFHSQLVGWAKIILPLCALALLSTLFLFARDANTTDELALAQATEIARQQRVTTPEFAGVTDDGSIIVITAKSARPDSERLDTIKIDDLRMRLDTTDGAHVEITAVAGEVDGRVQTASFLGLARLETSNGYEMETNGLIAELDTGRVTSNGLLEIRAPFGTLTAGMVTFEVASQQAGQQMLFTNGVRLLYTPQVP
jgi:lipopolysaccharide export system protein LptC